MESYGMPADQAEPSGERIAAFAMLWAKTVAQANFLPGGRAKTRVALEQITHRLAAAVMTEQADPLVGRVIGADLMAANVVAPDALGKSIGLISNRLLQDLGIGDEPAPGRLAELVGQLARGFTETLLKKALAAAEGINRAERDAWRQRQQALLAQVSHTRLHDPTTELPNRTAAIDELTRLLSSATAEDRLGLCMLFLPGFAAVNYSLGLATGDRLLRDVALRLRVLGETYGYFVGHPGGATFVLILARTHGPDDVAKAAHQAIRILPNPWHHQDHEIPVTAKAGIVERSAHGANPHELLRAADMALAWAKVDRHNACAIFDADRSEKDVIRHRLTNDLPAALSRGELALAYQPLVRLADQTIVGVEALMRWHHPVYGMVGPDTFIPLAVSTGLIGSLGTYVLEQACLQAARWQRSGGTSPLVSVNVAGAQLQQPGFPDAVERALAHTGLAPHRLQLEITEDAAVSSDETSLAALRTIQDLGTQIAVDDFGTGFSNLEGLCTMPIGAIKLAAGFVRMIDSTTSAGIRHIALVRNLVNLAHDLELSVTAEGIENAAQAQRLHELGCDLGQGYHLGRPATAQQITSLL